MCPRRARNFKQPCNFNGFYVSADVWGWLPIPSAQGGLLCAARDQIAPLNPTRLINQAPLLLFFYKQLPSLIPERLSGQRRHVSVLIKLMSIASCDRANAPPLFLSKRQGNKYRWELFVLLLIPFSFSLFLLLSFFSVHIKKFLDAV